MIQLDLRFAGEPIRRGGLHQFTGEVLVADQKQVNGDGAILIGFRIDAHSDVESLAG